MNAGRRRPRRRQRSPSWRLATRRWPPETPPLLVAIYIIYLPAVGLAHAAQRLPFHAFHVELDEVRRGQVGQLIEPRDFDFASHHILLLRDLGAHRLCGAAARRLGFREDEGEALGALAQAEGQDAD